MKKTLIFILTATFVFAGCASFRSGLQGEYEGKVEKNFGAEKVSVLFIIDHYHQAKGFDAIPKLESKRQILNDFDDLFIDALSELTNIGKYNTYTEYSSDVADPKRRAEKDSLVTVHDYIFRIKIMQEYSFAQYFLGSLFSTVSATLLPVPYKKEYSISVGLYNSEDILVKTYKRNASLSKWVQAGLIFIYPFHTEKRKTEEIYIQFLHDVFRQIESERILVNNN